jgi:hypothetical protein
MRGGGAAAGAPAGARLECGADATTDTLSGFAITALGGLLAAVAVGAMCCAGLRVAAGAGVCAGAAFESVAAVFFSAGACPWSGVA